MKKRKFAFLAILMSAMMVVAAGCSRGDDGTTISQTTGTGSGSTTTTTTDTSNQSKTDTADVVSASDAEADRVDITGDFAITTENGTYTQDGNVYTITAAGEYTLTGVLSEGQIVVAAGEEDEVTLILSGVSITCSTGSPICFLTAGEAKVKVAEDTFNEVIDSRDAKTEDTEETDDTEDDTLDTNRNAAIFAKMDLDITGKGTLVVTAGYNNGIQSKDDISIKNVTLKVTAVNNALKGKDSVTIESGEITLIAIGGDGIKTSNSDVSTMGNQKGTVSIEGGNVDIYACCDGIDAAYDVSISGEGNLNIYTADYSNYSGSALAGGSDFYIVLTSRLYDGEAYDYYAYFYNSDEDTGYWAQATYNTPINGGAYYGLLLTAPSGYENVAYFIFEKDATPSTTDYVAVSDGDTVNSSMNGYLISSAEDGTITGDYVSLSSGSSGSSDKSTQSSKGIKAANTVTIDGGTITIYCKDDGIHANVETLDNGESGAGTITINGGTITIYAADDGIHADTELTINGGTIDVVESYEGLESVLITINGGSVYVYASDDAMNACTGTTRTTTPTITVNGGYVDVTTPSGDTDAIDSNGNYVQTGGYVVVKGGASTGSMAGSVDVDGSVTVTGGTIVAMGGICELPVNSVNCYSESGTSLSAGDYEIVDSQGNVIASYTLSATYSSIWVASSDLEEGETYTLTKDGTEVTSWTQESGTMGSSSGWGGGGMGGMGGMGGGGRH